MNLPPPRNPYAAAFGGAAALQETILAPGDGVVVHSLHRVGWSWPQRPGVVPRVRLNIAMKALGLS